MPSKAQDVLESLTDYRKGDPCPRCMEDVEMRSLETPSSFRIFACCTRCDWSMIMPSLLRTVYDKILTDLTLSHVSAAPAPSDVPPQP